MIALGNKVIIKVIEEEENDSVIAVVKTRKDTLLKGQVISIGYETTNPLLFVEGSIVYFSAYGYEELGEYIITTKDMLYARA